MDSNALSNAAIWAQISWILFPDLIAFGLYSLCLFLFYSVLP
jgi:hypothetical protein